MVLDSMNHAKSLGLKYANAGGIDFPLSRERSDFIAYWYPVDDVSYLFNLFMKEMSDILVQQEG